MGYGYCCCMVADGGFRVLDWKCPALYSCSSDCRRFASQCWFSKSSSCGNSGAQSVSRFFGSDGVNEDSVLSGHDCVSGSVAGSRRAGDNWC